MKNSNETKDKRVDVKHSLQAGFQTSLCYLSIFCVDQEGLVMIYLLELDKNVLKRNYTLRQRYWVNTELLTKQTNLSITIYSAIWTYKAFHL
jgi:hypothetical protein